MKKIVLYTSFVAASLTEAAIFFTTNTYIQLIVAILLYLPLTYFAFKLFPRKTSSELTSTPKNNIMQPSVQKNIKIERPTPQPPSTEAVEISDINKRLFLKLIGATGLTFFISSLVSKKFEPYILRKPEEPSSTSIMDSTGDVIDPAKQHPTDNYKISEVDYGLNTFYGFIDENDAWFIMKEDINAGTYRYVKGDSNFPDNWNNRENLKYDYYNRVFTKP